MVDDIWRQIPDHYSGINVDEHIVMPNHMHGIIIVGAGLPRPKNETLSRNKLNNTLPLITNTQNDDYKGRGNRAPTLGQIVAYFKYYSTKQINTIRNTPGSRLWQRNYYEHVIRNEKNLSHAREYIQNNPLNWGMDQYNLPQKKARGLVGSAGLRDAGGYPVASLAL